MTPSRPVPFARAAVLAAVVTTALLVVATTATATPLAPAGLLPGPGAGATTSTTGDEGSDRTTTTRAAGGALVPSGVDPAEAAAARSDDGSGTSPVVLAGIGILGALVGLGVGWAVGRSGSSRGPAPAQTGAPGPAAAPHVAPPVAPPAVDVVPTVADPVRDQAVAHRAQLVQALIDVGDLVTSDAIRAQLMEHLRQVGVTPRAVSPDTPFDPGHHRGVQAVAAPDPTANGTVASCDRPGWADGDRLIRLPEVVVYRWEDPS